METSSPVGASVTAGASVAGTSVTTAGASVAAGAPQAAKTKEATTRRLIAFKSKLFFMYSSPWII
jgi:hypothetical protein